VAKIITPGSQPSMGVDPGDVSPLEMFQAVAKRVDRLEDGFAQIRQILSDGISVEIGILKAACSHLEKENKKCQANIQELLKEKTGDK
jgi:hypothetical protein